MSNIGKRPIIAGKDVTVQIQNGVISVTGTKGSLSQKIPEGIEILIEEGENGKKITVKKLRSDNNLDKYFGLTRSLVANMVKGSSTGFEKKLELNGVGFRARMEGTTLVLNIGFAAPVKIDAPSGVAIKVDDNTQITVSGSDKQLVGNTASIIRGVRPPDPYKAKGIKYVGEHIRRKVGKAAKAVGGK